MIPVTQGITQEADFAFKSPLLYDLLGPYREDGYCQVMDLLPASRQLIEYFSDRSCKLFLPGFRDGLLTMKPDVLDTETKLNRKFIKYLGFKKQNKNSLDIILLWNLPNYIDKDILRALILYLLPHCSDNVILHAYIHTRENMPASPGAYRLSGENKVRFDQRSDKTISSPMYYQETLQKIMSPFLVQKSILLSGGLQEYLFYRR